MTEEYEILRQALISLLCVGDKVYRVYTSVAYEETAAISTCTVIEIMEEGIRVAKNAFGPGVVKRYENIDMYEGKLYVWIVGCKYADLPPDERLEALIEIIESRETCHNEFG